MRLNLTKPLVVFDLEATGLDLVNDRIIQISYVKVSPGDKEGEEERKSIFVNPGKPIPAFVQQLTGITDDMVKDAPTFKQLAKQLADSFIGCDFAGFNSDRFDVPMLAEEFLRAASTSTFPNVASSTPKTFSTSASLAISRRLTGSTPATRWKTTSVPTVPTKTPRPLTVC